VLRSVASKDWAPILTLNSLRHGPRNRSAQGGDPDAEAATTLVLRDEDLAELREAYSRSAIERWRAEFRGTLHDVSDA
jgi:hypothetical protein